MRLPAEVVESLDRVCRVRFCARTEVIRQALLEYLERHGCGVTANSEEPHG
jgi:metal-responsive CopG/Arc/MetJ family transcriptional regulator